MERPEGFDTGAAVAISVSVAGVPVLDWVTGREGDGELRGVVVEVMNIVGPTGDTSIS